MILFIRHTFVLNIKFIKTLNTNIRLMIVLGIFNHVKKHLTSLLFINNFYLLNNQIKKLRVFIHYTYLIEEHIEKLW